MTQDFPPSWDPNDPYRYGRPEPLPPYGQAAYPGPVPAAPPPSIEWAFRLMLTRVALSIISLVTTLLQRDQLRAVVEKEAERTGTVSDVDSVYHLALTLGVGLSVVFIVLYALLALQVRRGQQWARVVTWVLAGLGVLGLLAEITGDTTGTSRVLGILGGLIDLALIILLAARTSSQYVAAVRGRR